MLVKFYCDVINRNHLHISIDTFISKLCAFCEEERRPMMVKMKLDGAVDESSADQEIRKSNTTAHSL